MYNFESARPSAMEVDIGGAQKGGAGVETIYQVFKNNLLEYQQQAHKYLNQDFNNFVRFPDDEAQVIRVMGQLWRRMMKLRVIRVMGQLWRRMMEAQGNQSDGDDTLATRTMETEEIERCH